MVITATSIVLSITLLLVFTFSIILYRRAQSINLGDGQDETMLRRVRTHGNFIEYTPLFLFTLFFCEFAGLTNSIFLAVVAGLFFTGRIAHAIGLNFKIGLCRVAGMILTLIAFIILAGIITRSLILFGIS